MSTQKVVTVTRPTKYYVSYGYLRSDPEDGTAAGWYGFVSSQPDDQSDFVLGPYKTEKLARKLVPDRLANGMPKRKVRRCIRCLSDGVPAFHGNGEQRFHCDRCLDDI